MKTKFFYVYFTALFFLIYSVKSFSADSVGNSCSTATALSNISSISSAIDSAGDVDYFKIAMLQNGSLTVGSTGSTDTYGDLKDGNCNTIASNDDTNGTNNFSISKTLNAGTYYIAIRHYRSSGTGSYSVFLTITNQSVASFISEADKKKACDLLYSKLNRPSLKSQKQIITSYVDPFTLPQTKTECTHTYVITKAVTGCIKWGDVSWTYPLGRCKETGVIVPETKGCDTWATYKKNMKCDLTFQMKLPNFIEKPLSNFVDQGFNLIESSRSQVAAALPIECADASVQQAARNNKSPTQALADAVMKQVENRVKTAVQEEVSDWIARTALKTIVSTVGTGGIGGVAMLGTSIGEIIYSIHETLQPIIKVANDVKTFGQDLGFDTDCGWAKEWERM